MSSVTKLNDTDELQQALNRAKQVTDVIVSEVNKQSSLAEVRSTMEKYSDAVSAAVTETDWMRFNTNILDAKCYESPLRSLWDLNSEFFTALQQESADILEEYSRAKEQQPDVTEANDTNHWQAVWVNEYVNAMIRSSNTQRRHWSVMARWQEKYIDWGLSTLKGLSKFSYSG